MIALISTYLPTTASELWAKIIKPKYLHYIVLPVLKFIPLQPGEFDDDWVVGKKYELKLYLFNIVPLGLHSIKLVKIDKENNMIVSEESGMLARVWNHTITFYQSGDSELRYTDVIEIRAGLLSPLIWVFAHLFYRHRQSRWRTVFKKIQYSCQTSNFAKKLNKKLP
ncbi:MAG: hypothetical protein KGY75_09115 [Candidatus Cloacimonetes bacterium]|nr:hypothetical protein [Candidatus Cloacimonadota bacterium]